MDLVNDVSQNNSAGTSNAEVLALKDESEFDMEDNANHNDETNDGSDTSLVVDSATTYARECLRTENFTEATIALRSVLEISKPSTTSYNMVVLHIAQLLKTSQQLKASIDCMLSVYRTMPPPLSTIDAICMIARSYEQLESTAMARIWWKKLTVLPPSNGLDIRLWEAMADRLFDRGLYVFAADFYAQALVADTEKRFVPSNRFRYRYLVTLLAFVGPQGRTAHMNWCRSVAWPLAQWFRRRKGSAAHILGCYVDSHFYLLRGVYFNSFSGMYRVVFAWMDGPAGRIARCWRHHRAKLHPPLSPAPSGPSSIPRKGNKKPTRRVASPSRQPRTQTRTGLCGKVSAPSSTFPPPTRKPRNVATKSAHQPNSIPRSKMEKNVKQQPQVLSTSGSNNNAPSMEENQQFKSAIEKRHAAKKKSNEFYENSPTKRKLTVVKRPRTKRPSADPTVERPSSAGAEDVSSDEEKNITRSSSTSLLDVYPLQLPRTEDVVATCGRAPGFADLDLNEVGEFARLAHYRARVLAGTHAPVNNLGTAQVKPQWLQDLERAAALIETHQQRNLASGKVVVEGDSVAHLSEIHTRLVLMITTLCRQYTRDFGETSFTRRLRGLTRKLVEWKFARISEVVAALNDVKSIATQEEKQRNLEFYHVHRA